MRIKSKGTFANIRPTASIQLPPIGRITREPLFHVIGEQKTFGFKWYKVSNDVITGYVREDVVELVSNRKWLTYLVLHCTATPEGRKVTKEEIIRWHTAPKNKGGRGWSKAGYSDMIDLEGEIINITPYNDDNFVDPWEVTNGASGINSISRHIVYVGGCDRNLKTKDTRNDKQLIAMEKYVKEFIKKHPYILVAGHNQFANKACPSFDTVSWLRSIGVEEKNIYKK